MSGITHKAKQSFNNLPPWARWAMFGIGIITVIVIVSPLLKGVKSIFGVAGDILSAPGKLIKALNESFDKGLSDLAFSQLWGYVVTHNYDPKNRNDQDIMARIEEFTKVKFFSKNGRDDLIKEWKTYKSPEEIKRRIRKIMNSI